MKRICFFLFAVAFLSACSHQQRYVAHGKIDYPLTAEDELLLDSIQRKTFLYFTNEHHPQWGVIKDRASEWSPSSIAASGFGIPVFAIGVERGWIAREQAAHITLNMLQFYNQATLSPDTNATGYNGFYYHFLDMETGTRKWRCELSSVDTGLLLMGAIFSRNFYTHENETESEIRQLTQSLLDRVDWSFMLMPDTGYFANTISMGWYPETGLHHMGWKGYNEALFLYILAAGMDMKNIKRSYLSWIDGYDWHEPYPGLSHVIFPPLFGHQFAHSFIDFRGLADPYMQEKGIDYFENSRRATYAQRSFSIENPHSWVGYDSLCWGITACDGPTDKYNSNGRVFYGYAGRGASGPNNNYFDDGTIAPYAALSSLPFAPEIVLPTIRSIMERNGNRIWGKYGFYDSFNQTLNWVNDDFIGIAQGPMLIMIENFRTGLVWEYTMRDPIIQKGLRKLKFDNL